MTKLPWIILGLFAVGIPIGIVVVRQNDAAAETHNAKLRREFIDDLNIKLRSSAHIDVDVMTTTGEYDDVIVLRALPCDRSTLRMYLVNGLANLATAAHFYAMQCSDGSARLLQRDDWR